MRFLKVQNQINQMKFNKKILITMFLTFFSIFQILILSANAESNEQMEQRKMKKIGFIIANEAFRDEEYLESKKVLDKAGLKTITIAKELKVCNGRFGAKIIPDMELSAIDTKNFDAIVFIGGPGCKIYWHDKKAHEICKEIVDQNKILAAICSSVATPSFAGVLKGKRANSFESEQIILKKNGAIVVKDDVVVDGNIITATGPKVAREFGEEIKKKL